jgi:Spy/CpxP family protein refolding chaperone
MERGMTNSKRLALAFLLGALLVGGVLGFTTARVFGRAGHAYLDSRNMSELLAADLRLTDEQRAQLDAILDRRHRDMVVVLAPVRPQLDSIRERARNEIRHMLTGDQGARFERILVKQEREQQGMRGGGAGNRD